MKIRHAWCTDNAGTPLCDENVKRFISVRPSENQMEFNEMKYYTIMTFSIELELKKAKYHMKFHIFKSCGKLLLLKNVSTFELFKKIIPLPV